MVGFFLLLFFILRSFLPRLIIHCISDRHPPTPSPISPYLRRDERIHVCIRATTSQTSGKRFEKFNANKLWNEKDERRTYYDVPETRLHEICTSTMVYYYYHYYNTQYDRKNLRSVRITLYDRSTYTRSTWYCPRSLFFFFTFQT